MQSPGRMGSKEESSFCEQKEAKNFIHKREVEVRPDAME